jgi:hypothetical protein
MQTHTSAINFFCRRGILVTAPLARARARSVEGAIATLTIGLVDVLRAIILLVVRVGEVAPCFAM